ncbi:hypothetical protein GCM10010470_23610 [Saccharopolyspora taberi]|uniref:Uncharacterized protein n=1 Tax=Saccharopolyspora taberi TaxID=60895 RepID=A0ABN3VEC3_9PSEU
MFAVSWLRGAVLVVSRAAQVLPTVEVDRDVELCLRWQKRLFPEESFVRIGESLH